jgi:hypothetical protein
MCSICALDAQTECPWIAQGEAATIENTGWSVLACLVGCDGTFADSMPLYYIVWKSALAEWNCDFPEDLFHSRGGFPVMEIISRLNENRGLRMPVPEVVRLGDSFASHTAVA